MLDNQKYMCYVTYAIPMDKIPVLPDFLPIPKEITAPEVPTNTPNEHPPGFVMKWFQDGGFPEDDID